MILLRAITFVLTFGAPLHAATCEEAFWACWRTPDAATGRHAYERAAPSRVCFRAWRDRCGQ